MKKPNFTCQNFVLIGLVVPSFLLFFQMAQATNIEKLFNELQVGQRVRIKLAQTPKGELIADRIQMDKGSSKPKIRAAIQKINKEENTLELLGLKIKVSESTETDLGKNVNLLESLKPGQRVEVKIRVREDSSLKATRILTKNIKASDKIEAYIEKKMKGGTDYFYLELLGLKIKIDSGTDILKEISESYSPLEKRLVDIDETRAIQQIKLGDFLIVEGGIEWNLTPQRNYQSYDSAAFVNNLSGNGNLNDKLVSTGILMDLELTGKYHKKLEGFTKIRFFGSHTLVFENRARPDGRGRLQVREAYLLYRDILNWPVGIKVGRQDFDETREWIYDHNLDAARLYLYPVKGWVTEFSYVIGSFPKIKKFKKIRDLIFYTNWEFYKNQNLGFYFLDRDDHSDSINAAGRPLASKPRWFGFRANGKLRTIPILFRYWSELSLLRGSRPDKGRNFEAYAFDIGNTLALNSWWEPSVTIGYAYGSGDPPPKDQTIKTFKQTSYHDNTGRFNGVATFQYYGQIFDPELSNLKILTIGTGIKPNSLFSFDFVYHSYRQVVPSQKLEDTDLVEPFLTGFSTDLGWETDFVFGIEKLKNFDFKLIISYFKPGEAFATFFFFDQAKTWYSRLAVEFNF